MSDFVGGGILRDSYGRPIFTVRNEGDAKTAADVEAAGTLHDAAGRQHIVLQDSSGNPFSAGSAGLTPTAVKSAPYTAVSGDLVLVDTTGGAVPITLPAAAVGAIAGVKLVTVGAGNSVTIAAAGSDVFNKAGGATTLTLSLLNQGVVLAAKAGVWVVQSDDLALSQLDARYGSASAVTAATAAAAAAQASVASTALGQAFGTVNGVATPPWQPSPPIGPEFWTLANFAVGGGWNSTTLTPLLTYNGSNQSSVTHVQIGNPAAQDQAFRVEFDVSTVPASNGGGTWAVTIAVTDTGGNVLSGTAEQYLIDQSGKSAAGRIIHEFKVGAWGVASTYLRIKVQLNNNNSSGDQLGITNVTVREIAEAQHPMTYVNPGTGLGRLLYMPLFDPTSGTWRSVSTEMTTDGALASGLAGVIAYNTDRPFQNDTADPDFVAAWTGSPGRSQISLAAGEVARPIRIGNNDQIIEVQKADLSYELRGNTHGGETARTAATWAADYGDGVWHAISGQLDYRRYLRRMQFTFNTSLTRSAPDNDTFANVDHLCTFFPDGMMRMDRTTTFLAARRIRNLFEWMSSHPTTVPAIGRIGAGTIVLDEIDTYPKVAPPAAPTITPAGTGGTLAAGTYAYSVTALASGGETTASPTATGTTTGTTSKNTVAWSAVTGAEGYCIYGRRNGVGLQTLLATVGPGVTSWDDTNAVPQFGVIPPLVNRARQLEAASLATDSVVSHSATWAVWYDQFTNTCYGNIFDRDSALTRPGVAAIKTRLQGGAGVRKNYATVHWTGDGNPSPPINETRLVPSGEVWTATHWAFIYVPADPRNYHIEIAARAANLSALKTLYPAT